MFRLALALGKTVNQIGREMSSHELGQWMALYRIEPFGDERNDLHAGIVASTIVNCTPRKDSRQYKPTDFMPRWDRQDQVDNDPDQKIAKAEWAKVKKLFGKK